MGIIHQSTQMQDLHRIITFPQNKQEVFHLFTITEKLTLEILKSFNNKRFGATTFIINGEVIGYSNFYRYKSDSKDIIYLGNVILDANYRGCGYGKEMVNIMMNKAQYIFAAKELRLAVFYKNISAKELYKKEGFKLLRTEKRVNLNNELEKICIMAKKLNT